MNSRIDRTVGLDALVVAVSAFTMYFFCALPGVGWGDEAVLQTDVALFFIPDLRGGGTAAGRLHPILTMTAAVFSAMIPVGSPALRVTMLSIGASTITLVVVFLGIRQLAGRRASALMSVVALAFSHSFFMHAVRPSVYALSVMLFAIEIALVVRYRLLGQKRHLIFAWVVAIIGTNILPVAAMGFVTPALFITAMGLFRVPYIFIVLLAAHAGFIAVESNLGSLSYALLLLFLAFQFPFVGWLLSFWGGMFLARRFPGIFGILMLSAISAAPLVYGKTLNEFFGAMLISSIPIAYLVGLGGDYLLEKFDKLKGEYPIVPAVIFGSLVLMPLMTMLSALYSFRNADFDQRLAEQNVWMIEENRWRDDFWYSFWPPKHDQGSAAMLDEIESVLPNGALMIAEAELTSVLEYGRYVEGRFVLAEAVAVESDGQFAMARRATAAGRRVFLAGIAPARYDVASFTEHGELRAAGAFYEWIADPRKEPGP